MSAEDAPSSSSRVATSAAPSISGSKRPLAAVGADDEVDIGSRLGPAGQRPTAGDIGIVRVGIDGEHHADGMSSITCAWAPSSWSAGRLRAGSRRPPSKPLYTLAKRRYATSSSALRCSNTTTPTCWLVGSAVSARSDVLDLLGQRLPWRSSVTGRFLQADRIPATTLARSNGSRRPVRLTTQSGTSSTRSNVVNRRLQPRHSRRRRMAPPSSAIRESTTRSSSTAHHGHRTPPTIVRESGGAPRAPRPTNLPPWPGVCVIPATLALSTRAAMECSVSPLCTT